MAENPGYADNGNNPSLFALSNDGLRSKVTLWADPSTHALVTSGGGSGGGGTQYTDGAAAATHPIGTQPVFTNGSNIVTAVSTANPLPITGTISVGSTTDSTAFTAGTSTTGPIAGVFNDSVATLTSGTQGTIRATTNRGLHTNLRNAAGTEIGTSSTPVRIDPTGTTTQPVSLASTTITGSVAVTGTFFQTTQPVSGTITGNQGTAAALTSGWPTINGELSDVTGTFTNATQTTSVTATGLDGYGNTLISINGTYGTATAVFEGSDDGGTTWYTVQAARDNNNVIELGYTSQTNTSQTWQINNPGFDSLRVRSTAVASGTVNVRLSSSAAPVASGTIIGLGTSIPAGSNAIGSITNTSFIATQATGTNLHVVTDSGTITTVSAVTAITNALPAGTNVIGHVIADSGSTTVVTGTVTTKEQSSTSAVTSVASSGTTVSLLVSNTNRRDATFYNDSTQILYLKLGATASTTSYTVQMAAGSYYEVPQPCYTGAIDGIWASANGSVRITEIST